METLHSPGRPLTVSVLRKAIEETQIETAFLSKPLASANLDCDLLYEKF
jgi:hypothetical protein